MRGSSDPESLLERVGERFLQLSASWVKGEGSNKTKLLSLVVVDDVGGGGSTVGSSSNNRTGGGDSSGGVVLIIVRVIGSDSIRCSFSRSAVIFHCA